MKRGLRDVKGVVEQTGEDEWTQEAADAALARNAQKHLLALLRELTSLAEAADASPELPDIAERLRCAVACELGMNPGGAFFLWDAVSAAFDIGRLLPKDPASQAKVEKRTAAATAGKQRKAQMIGYLVRQWRAKGMSVEKIRKTLAELSPATGIAAPSQSTIYVYLKQDDDDRF
jgi:hypothetical protein